MARHTPPIAIQVVDPRQAVNARFQKRLIDFDTDSDVLEWQHQTWLRTSMSLAKLNSDYYIRIFAYASKAGDSTRNRVLARARANSTLNFLRTVDTKALGHVDMFEAHGGEKTDSVANEAYWRAVEVQIFIGSIPPPPPPPNLRPIPRIVIPLPGGERFTRWEVAAPGGVTVGPGLVGGFNIYFIKDPKGKIRGFFQPQAGIGGSLSIPGLNGVKAAVQTLLTSASYSNLSFTAVTSSVEITWEEISRSLVRVTGGGAGALVIGYAAYSITFMATSLWKRGPSGQPINVADDRVLFQFTSAGMERRLGLSLAITLGTLYEIN